MNESEVNTVFAPSIFKIPFWTLRFTIFLIFQVKLIKKEKFIVTKIRLFLLFASERKWDYNLQIQSDLDLTIRSVSQENIAKSRLIVNPKLIYNSLYYGWVIFRDLLLTQVLLNRDPTVHENLFFEVSIPEKSYPSNY